MTPQQRRQSRAARWFGGSLLAVVALTTLVLLIPAALLTWTFGVAAPASHRRAVAMQLADNRRWAAEVQRRLIAAAADGTLSDQELAATLSRRWMVDRSSDQWLTVVAQYNGTDDYPLCYTYVFTLPLGLQSQVTRTEARQCPTIPAAPRVSPS